MKNRRAVGLLNPMRDKKNEGKRPGGGGKGRHLPVTTAFFQKKLDRRCSVEEEEKKKNNVGVENFGLDVFF